MSTPTGPSRREYPSTYIVQGPGEDELRRLAAQDRMITTSMGGVLPEQPDPARFQRVLDVGCGTGGWLIEAAKAYPNMRQLVGVDRSGRLLDYAQAQAEAQSVQERVEFHLMDALRMLEFPTGYFDLVNLRFGTSFLRRWDWPKLLQEFQRVSRSGGIVRVTEPEMRSESNSPAHMRLQLLNVQAAHQAGLAFAPDGRGALSEVPLLLRQHGLEQVQTRTYTLEFRAGTPEGELFIEDSTRVFRTALPFLRKWTRLPDDYEAIYQQMLTEMHHPDFAATWKMVTAWGSVAAT
ncbi:MAG TPA: class I SAM-dependent methyltransferase [Ktedonobacteraceae bacterium]|nr:class I SAM-dependent methyltransferase [Ktedonobacteraceae bacterium]